MENMQHHMDEEQFWATYDVNAFERPSVATDVVVLSMFEEQNENHRKDSQARLHLLLVKRGEHPYMNDWALPGGFLRPTETVEECAVREIREETNLSLSTLIPIGTFSEPERDPRGRVISLSFASVINEKTAVMSGSDAIATDWFTLDYEFVGDVIRFRLTNGEVTLSAELIRTKTSYGHTLFKEVSNDGIAFDHDKIIAMAVMALRERLEEGEIAFAFLPERFTLSALQRVYEMIGGAPLLTANFRRKTAHLVKETDDFTEGAGHRPARLFVKNDGTISSTKGDETKESAWKK